MGEMIPVVPLAGLGEGDMIGVTANGVDVMVCQVEGQFYALQDMCSHARQALSKGRLRGFDVICPLHGARFDVRTGECRAAPATRPVKKFPVIIEGGKVCVTVSEDDRPPPPRFGPV